MQCPLHTTSFHRNEETLVKDFLIVYKKATTSTALSVSSLYFSSTAFHIILLRYSEAAFAYFIFPLFCFFSLPFHPHMSKYLNTKLYYLYDLFITSHEAQKVLLLKISPKINRNIVINAKLK